jgi:Peptidase family M23
MLTLYLIQSLLPVVLVAWLAIFPPRSLVSFWVQSIAIGMTIVALSFVGIWTFPPWWVVYAFVGLWAATVIGGLARRRSSTWWPRGVIAWIVLFGFGALGLYSANETRIAYAATAILPERTINLASPVGPGTYLVANGGAALSVNAHAELLDQSVPAHRLYWGTAHGVDLVALDRWGLRVNGVMPADPHRYVIFGRAVIAPCAGEVIVAVDGLPDMPVPQVDRDHLAGNHIILRCADADILLGHFHKGSVRVQGGQRLNIGDPVAQVGNSGNTSEPHLHINAQKPGTPEAPFSGAPIPIRIDGRYLVRNSRFIVPTPGTRP